MSECTQERFLSDVARHEMTIQRDDGVYRHITFQRPGSSSYRFDLVTWPGHLAYSGDMGCYVFSRLEDMFEFFRTDRKHRDPAKGLAINLGYWSQKLISVSGNRHRAEVMEFCEKKFNRILIREYLIPWIRDTRYQTTGEERRELWDAVISEVIGAPSDDGGVRKQCAAHDFRHRVNEDLVFEFHDLFEYNFITDYDFYFVWCCYALAWGVEKYDEAKCVGGKP